MKLDKKVFSFKIYSWMLFSFLMVYFVLRALFLAPLHDESATFLHFIEPEIWFGESVMLDANNHLFNSFLGSLLHSFFGNEFFLFRLPSLLCFPIYFWGIYTFLKSIDNRFTQIILLTAAVTVVYMNDYFSYSRGYAMAISFFIWMLVYAQRFVKESRTISLILLYVFSFLAVFSNLVFLVSACLALVLALIIHLKNIRNFAVVKNVFLLVVHIAFIYSLLPIISFGQLLKEHGALYYGSLDGFWIVTGKTLSKYVLYYDADWLKWFFILLFILFLGLLIYLLFKRGFWKQAAQETTILSWFLFGNIIAIFVLAIFMKVNYPEDRAGMYFIPLIILLVGFFSHEFHKWRYIQLILLFFPITAIFQLNLNTSIFTPDERFDASFYQQVKKTIDTSTTVSVYHTMALNWDLLERQTRDEVKIQPNILNEFSPLYDVIINKSSELNVRDLKDYQLLCKDLPSGFVAYKRTKPLQKIKIRSSKIGRITSNDEYINLLELKSLDSIRNEDLLVKLAGNFKIITPFHDVRLIFTTFNAKNETVRYETYDQRWIHGANQGQFKVKINSVFKRFYPEEIEFRLYIWNPQHSKINFENGSVHFYKLKE
jgi:hypothetical protein